MKKFTQLLLCMGCFSTLFAQAPQKFNYQGVARSAIGVALPNQAISVRLSVLDGSASGATVYSETHSVTTNSLGLFNIAIGGGTPVAGTFNAINWAGNSKFLKTELDPAGGSAYLTMGTTQFLSVPYAMTANTANTANSLTTPPSLSLDDLSNVNVPAPTVGQQLLWNGTNWVAGTATAAGDNWGAQSAAVGTALIGNGTAASPLNLAAQGATSGQVLKWNGTAWTPGTDNTGAGGSYTAGTGISITGTTINSYWTFAANNLYNNNTGVVGIGTTSPAATTKFSVVSTLENAGTFATNSTSTNAAALVGSYAGTTQVDGIGVLGNSVPQDYYGIGGLFTGGYIGAIGTVQNALNDDYTGLVGSVTPSAGGTGAYVGVNGNADAESGIAAGGNFVGSGDASLGIILGLVAEVSAINSPTLTAYTDLGTPGAYLLGNAGRGGYASNTGSYTFGTGTIGTGFFGISSPTTTANYSIGLAGQGEAGTTSSTGAEFYGVSTGGAYGLGLYATASGGTTNYAGYFDGDVEVNGNLSKGGGTFKIDHPQDPANKYLLHSFVESPDMMNIYNGNITTDANGMATVTLPAYFEALNMDFRYQLTTIGTFAQAIVANEVQSNQFTIQTDKPNVKVSWQVTGVRKDAWANAHRVVPEMDKVGAEKGRYLHPELFGLGRSASIGEVFSSAKGELKPSTPVKLNLPSGANKNKVK
ncbi:MAG: hypothetical protein ACKVTZ_14400 [Bacteroidia bacterium]